MYEIDNQKFGVFLLQRRKEHGMTQKDLAEKLCVSDKAVSKWERGLSLPDISLLQPIADILDITVTELLAGKYIREDQSLNIADVEPIVRKSLYLTAQEQMKQGRRRRSWKMVFLLACFCAMVELAVLFFVLQFQPVESTLIIPPMLAFIFGIHFIFFAKERLPEFYDENKISFYASGAFRMNMIGLHFNNSNWPYILRVVRAWCVGILAVWPALYWIFQTIQEKFLPGQAEVIDLPLILLAIFLGGLFIPIYVVGRKYE